MTMIISKISNAQGHYQVNRDQASFANQASDSKSVDNRQSAHSGMLENGKKPSIGNDQAEINRLESRNAERNQFAKHIRTFAQKMDKVSAQIEKMNKELSIIVKNYPPFPPGSEERIQRLRRFNSFRKQLEQFTIPPQRESNHIKTGAPTSRQVGVEQGSLVIEADEGDGFILSVRNADAQEYRMELRVPKLSEDADDAQIYDSLENLDKAGVAIVAHRQIVKLSVQKIRIGQEDSEASIISEGNAEESSYALRRDMAMITPQGFTKEPAKLVGLLN
jgi:hypothetical protein